jgi:hypothetical protein
MAYTNSFMINPFLITPFLCTASRLNPALVRTWADVLLFSNIPA